jgi:aromatic-L-amino-acid/L-tryptophan decarboxylase
VVNGLGLAGLREHIRSHVAMAADLAARVRADPRFTVAAPPSMALVCLRVATGSGSAADDTASRIVLERVNASGRALLTHTVVDGRYLIRVAVGSVATRPADVIALWEQLGREADAVLGGRTAPR